MEGHKTNSQFLERKGYRQRRLRDVARMSPVVGGVLWTIPLFWKNGDPDGIGNATALLYIFGIWVLVIILTAIIARLIEPGSVPEEAESQR